MASDILTWRQLDYRGSCMSAQRYQKAHAVPRGRTFYTQMLTYIFKRMYLMFALSRVHLPVHMTLS